MNLFKLYLSWLSSSIKARHPVDDDPVEMMFDRSIDAPVDLASDDHPINDDSTPSTTANASADLFGQGVDGDAQIGCDINPANGLPMIGGCGGVDIEGNPYGVDSSDFGLDSTDMDMDWSDSSSDFNDW